MHVLIVADVVAVVAQRRRIKRHEPDRVDAELPDVAELRGEPLEITDAVVVRIEEGLDVHLINDGVLVPQGVVAAASRGRDGSARRQPRVFDLGCHHA
jgi:hypothetical protein